MTEHLAVPYEHPDGGWAYACLCGYESYHDLSEEDATKFAKFHEGAE